MPLMHSEDARRPASARWSSSPRSATPTRLDFARLHHDQIDRFGRFPGRNAALGRRSTPEEQDALDDGAAF